MKTFSAFVAAGSLFGPVLAATPDPMAVKVAALVEDTLNAEREAAAFSELERLGDPAVPYIIGHLSDFRPLPIKAISLQNHFPGAFEEFAQYAPQTVDDALSSILSQLTKRDFEVVSNGASPEVRRRNVKAWVEWCMNSLPTKAEACEHGL